MPVEVKQNSSDSDEPARTETSPNKLVIEEENPSVKVSIYDSECMFLAPSLILHPSQYRMLTLKLSLDSFISSSRDLSCLLLSMVNRQSNKKMLMQLAQDLILTKRLSLIGISKFFTKLNQVYKQAGQERSNIKKKSLAE